MAAWASAWVWNFTKAQPGERRRGEWLWAPQESWPGGPSGQEGDGATFAGAIGPPKHSAFVYGPKRLKHLPHILICLLLSKHPHKELPVFWEGGHEVRGLLRATR